MLPGILKDYLVQLKSAKVNEVTTFEAKDLIGNM